MSNTKFTPETHMFRNVTGAVILAITAFGNRLAVMWKDDDGDLNTNLNDTDSGEDSFGADDYDLVEKPKAIYWSEPGHVPDSILRMRQKGGLAQLVINATSDGVLITNNNSYPQTAYYSNLNDYEWCGVDRPGEWFDCTIEG